MNHDGLERYLYEGSPLFKLISYLLENKGYDYSVSEMSRQTGVSRGKIDRMIPVLLACDIVVKSRCLGKSDMYWTELTAEQIARRIELITGQRWVVV